MMIAALDCSCYRIPIASSRFPAQDWSSAKMSIMTYKGYAARIEFDPDDRIFVGHVAGIRDTIGFHGSTVDELEKAFRESVDDYVQACNKLGQRPERPASGKLMLRVPPAVHASAVRAAELAGKSLNQWAAQVLSEAATPRR
jgi:predicted HicB family RNase H-like nuclease